MGLESLQANMREWIVRAFHDRDYILGKTTTSREFHFPSGWPTDTKKQKGEITYRVYDIYNPSGGEASYSHAKSLESAAVIPALKAHMSIYYAHNGKAGYDSDFLHFDEPTLSDQIGTITGRLIVHYDHANVEQSARLARYLQREFVFRTGGLSQFKIAGPALDIQRTDSAILFLTQRGVERKDAFADTISSLIDLKDPVPYGSLRLRQGIAFCRHPRKIPQHDWKVRYYKPIAPSFGGLLSTYIARALQELGPGEDADGLADRVARLLVDDRIDPLAVHELSEQTRQMP